MAQPKPASLQGGELTLDLVAGSLKLEQQRRRRPLAALLRRKRASLAGAVNIQTRNSRVLCEPDYALKVFIASEPERN
jgi:hypothetical protein